VTLAPRLLAAVATVAAVAALPEPALASQLVDRNATHVVLNVNAKGEALLIYRKGTTTKHVLAWGAVDAVPPTRSRKQVAFKLDYQGGYGKYRNPKYWQTDFNGSCLPYDGPALAWKIAACKAPDGSYWALQAWQRELANYGVKPTAARSVRELRLSHWTGEIPVLDITVDWSYRKFDHLFGTLTYGGVGVYGFKSTKVGVPLDTFGRNIYVDTLNSAYGRGWKRENSFLTHGPGGSFCYGFYAHKPHPSGKGTRYRATVIGPGVAPDPMWIGDAPGAYDAAADAEANAAQLALHDPKCRQG
jgi:hypothetical protein